MYEHNALGYWSGLALCLLTKVRSSRARCPATALIFPVVTITKIDILKNVSSLDSSSFLVINRKIFFIIHNVLLHFITKTCP